MARPPWAGLILQKSRAGHFLYMCDPDPLGNLEK